MMATLFGLRQSNYVTSCLPTHVYTSWSDLSLSPPVPRHTTFNAKDNIELVVLVGLRSSRGLRVLAAIRVLCFYSKRATYCRQLDIMEQRPCFCSCRTLTVRANGDDQRYVGRFRHPQRWRSTAYCLGRSPSLFQDIRSRSFRIMRHLPSASSILYHY
jgi:hypothetical protein